MPLLQSDLGNQLKAITVTLKLFQKQIKKTIILLFYSKV